MAKGENFPPTAHENQYTKNNTRRTNDKFVSTQHLGMRDALADATKCVQDFKKQATGPMGAEFSYRAIAAT